MCDLFTSNLFCVYVSTVDPALDAVLMEYNEKRNCKNQEIKGNIDRAQEGEVCNTHYESDDDHGSERVLPLDEEVIKRHRLTLDEIHSIPRFKDFQPGFPNEVLLVKYNILCRKALHFLSPTHAVRRS